MNLTEETKQDDEERTETTESVSSKKRRRGCLQFFLWTFLFVAFASITGVLYLRSQITAPIDVKNTSTVQALGWLTMRDLSQESVQTREDLFQMYVGNATASDVSGESGKALELPENVKKAASVFFKDRDKKIEAWSRTTRRAPYLRLDYAIVPRQTENRSSQYVVSDDVQPGPSLKSRWERAREALKSKNAPRKTCVEKNVQLLVMQWFVSKMKSYDATPDKRKRRKLESFSDELMRTQVFYNELKGTPKGSSRVQTLREFEANVESWNEFATVEELAKTLWFKDLLVSVTASRTTGIRADAESYPPLLPKKYREDSKDEREFERRAQTVCDAVRNYFFDASKERRNENL